VHVGFALLTLFPGRVGGSESNVRGLLGEYAAGNGPERVTVLANRHVARAYRSEGPVEVREVRSYRPGDGMATRALAMASAMAFPRLAARDVPDGLDVVHYPVTVPIPRTEAPSVVTLLDVVHHDLPGSFSRAERAFRRRTYDRAAREADVVVTISEFSRERIAATLGIDPGRIEAVPLGVDHDRFTPDGERAQLDLPGRFLLYPANLWPHKNHDRLLEALALAPGVQLVLSGQHYGRLDGLEARARSLGVSDRVRHLGHVPHDTLAPLLRSATGLVFPSLYEGFGAPPVEAMACGCPVAVSDRGSLPEVVGDAALLFDPESPPSIAEAMTRLIEDEAARERLREAGLRRAAGYTWSAAAERHRAIYAGAAGAY
jgi:glycosyltransferase involved in cell wall biosynthesis